MAIAKAYIAKAASYIGVSGTDNIFNTWIWGKHVYDPDKYPWCAAFQSYVAVHDLGMAVNPSASAAGVANQGTRVDDSQVQPGDWVVFNWDGRTSTGWCDHIGLVEWFDHNTGYFGTIEGNCDDRVQRVTRYNYSNYFTAFFRPPYDGKQGTATQAPASKPQKASFPAKPQWQGDMIGLTDTTKSGDDYAGVAGRPILYIAIEGAGRYQVSDVVHRGFWPEVSKYDLKDEDHGMAGNGDEIDRLRIFDPTVKYQLHEVGGGWHDVMQGLDDTGGSGDDYAGEQGKQHDLVRIWRDDGPQPRYNVYS